MMVAIGDQVDRIVTTDYLCDKQRLIVSVQSGFASRSRRLTPVTSVWDDENRSLCANG